MPVSPPLTLSALPGIRAKANAKPPDDPPIQYRQTRPLRYAADRDCQSHHPRTWFAMSALPGEFGPPHPNPPPNPKEPQTSSALPDATEKPPTPAPARPPLPLSALSGARVGERLQPPALSRQRIRQTRPLRCAAGRDCRLPHHHAARIKQSSPAASIAWHRDSLIRDRKSPWRGGDPAAKERHATPPCRKSERSRSRSREGGAIFLAVSFVPRPRLHFTRNWN